MIIMVRIGEVEAMADDEITGSRPVPELIEDTAHRLQRVAIEAYAQAIYISQKAAEDVEAPEA